MNKLRAIDRDDLLKKEKKKEREKEIIKQNKTYFSISYYFNIIKSW